MRTSRIFGIVGGLGVIWCGTLLTANALMPGIGLFEMAVASTLVYTIWMCTVAAFRRVGDLLGPGRMVNRVFGPLAALCGGLIILESGMGAPALVAASLGTLAIFQCMPLPHNGFSPRDIAQPLCSALGFILFALSLRNVLTEPSGLVLAGLGAIMIGGIFAMWLWTSLAGPNASGALYLMNPVPCLLAAFALFNGAVPGFAILGALCMAWGMYILARPTQAESDVARILYFYGHGTVESPK